MDSGIGSSIPELKDFQIGSWVPATPAKPGLLTLEPIRDDRCDLTNLVTDGGVNSWEAAVASKSSMQEGALNLENFSIDHADNWNNVSFGNLLALAHAAGTTAPVENSPASLASLISITYDC